MTKHRVFVIVSMVVVAVLLAAAIAAAGGVVGYIIARRSLARDVPWRAYQHERQLLPAPFLQLPPATGRGFAILSSGAQVTWVEEGGPAGEAGIEAGDIITAVDDQEIDEEHPLQDLILGHEPGEKVTLTLNRQGEGKEIEVTLGETTDQAGTTSPYLGIRYRSIERPRFFQHEQSDQSHLLQPKLSLLEGVRSSS